MRETEILRPLVARSQPAPVRARAGAAAALLAASVTASAAPWYWQAAQPTSHPIYSVGSLDADNALAGARTGDVLKTRDGGATWITLATALADDVNVAQVQYIDADHLVAVGGSGLDLDENHPHGSIARSDDGGLTWTTQLDGPNLFVSDVHFSSPDVGVAAGFFADLDEGVLTPMFWNTADGGANWHEHRLDGSGLLLAMTFVDAQTGYAAGIDTGLGAGLFLETTDGGATWQSLAIPVFATLTGLAFADADHGIVVAADGEIVTTDDGGATWTARNSGTSLYLSNVAFDANGDAVAVGGDQASSTSGLILRSTDGGASWTSQTVDRLLEDVHFSDAEHGIATGHGGEILLSADGGASWTEAPSVAPIATSEMFGVAFRDDGAGLAVGVNGAIIGTSDGGNNWHVRRADDGSGVNLLAVATPDDDFAMAVGGNAFTAESRVLVSTDGGRSWLDRTPQPATPLHAVSCESAGHCTVVGECFAILHTVDGGETWDLQHGDQGCAGTGFLKGVDFIGSDIGTAVGYAIERTTDGGANWVQQDLPFAVSLSSVSFIDANTGWAAGLNFQTNHGVVIHTTDGGANWAVQSDAFAAMLTSVKFRDADHGYATSSDGSIYATVDGGVTWTKDAAISGFLDAVTLLDDGSARAVGGADAFSVVLATGGAPIHLGLHPSEVSVCRDPASEGASAAVVVTPNGSHPGGDVPLALGALPAGVHAALDDASVNAPAFTSLRVRADESATAGDYVVRITDTGDAETSVADLQLHIADAPPTPALLEPADGRTDVATLPTLSWNIDGPVQLQVATDEAFANRVIDTALTGDHYFASTALAAGTPYFWRVRSTRGCTGAWSATFTFTTLDRIFADGFDSAAPNRAPVHAHATTNPHPLPDVPMLRPARAATRRADVAR